MAVVELHERHQELIDELLADVAAYNPEVDRDLIARAFRYAARAHEGQQRRSGEEFVLHPWGAAKICAQFWRTWARPQKPRAGWAGVSLR